MKELYQKMLDAYRSNDDNLFTASVRNWIEASSENPFKQDTKEHELFFKAQRAYKAWKNGSINARVSKQKMVGYVRLIAEMNIPNPYVKQKKVEPIKVLGILPEEEQPKKKKRFFFKKGGDLNDGE